jgi:SAM-dependent MidA family methyltransferase
LYKRTQYTIVELSAHLSHEQRRRGARHGTHFRSVNMSAAEYNKRIDEPVFVIALEVYVSTLLFMNVNG